jgi:hypothetical protein
MKKVAWALFSRYIKLRHSWQGKTSADRYCKCVTCGMVQTVDSANMHAGHFLDGRTKGILFHEYCVHPQCKKCNIMKHGNKDVYWPYMLKTYGQDVIDELLALKRRHQGSWTISELQDICDLYENKIRELE